MGTSPSLPLDEELLEEYVQLTFLKKAEIQRIWKEFYFMNPEEVRRNPGCFLPVSHLEELLPQLKVNPFVDRLYAVFFSRHDEFSFEELLDMCSAMSPNCPDTVKAMWAFRVFDFNNNKFIDTEDIMNAIDRLLQKKQLPIEEKKKIVENILKEVDLGKTGDISSREFVHALSKMPDFSLCFQLKI